MKLLVILAIYPFFFALAQDAKIQNILQLYDDAIILDDDYSLKILNQKIDNLVKNKELVLSSDLKKKYLQTNQYLKTKEKLTDCLKNSKDEFQLNLDLAITQNLKRNIYAEKLENVISNCFRISEVSPDLSSFDQLLESFGPSKQYQYYSHVQAEIYDKAMNNAMSTYADLLGYEFEGKPEEWNEYLRKELSKNFCKPLSVDIKKVPPPPTDTVVKNQNISNVNANCQNMAKKVSTEFAKRERIPLDKAAEYFNEMVDHLDGVMTKAIKTKSDQDYLAYVSTYQAILSKSPGTLLLTDKLQDTKNGIGNIVDKETLDNKEYSSFHKKLPTENDQHLKILKEALKEAKDKTKAGIKNIHQNFYQKEQDDHDAKNYSHLVGKIQKSRRKSDIEDLVKYYPYAASQMLANDPLHVFAVCEAIMNAEKSNRINQKVDTAVMWGGMIVGGALLVTGVGSAVGVGVLGATATVGGISLASIGTVAGTVGMGVGLAESTYSAAKSIQYYNESKNYEAALYANNSDNIKALDESYKNFKSALLDAKINLAFSAVDLGALKFIAKTRPIDLRKTTEELKNLGQNANIADVKKALAQSIDKNVIASNSLAQEDLLDQANKKLYDLLTDKNQRRLSPIYNTKKFKPRDNETINKAIENSKKLISKYERELGRLKKNDTSTYQIMNDIKKEEAKIDLLLSEKEMLEVSKEIKKSNNQMKKEIKALQDLEKKWLRYDDSRLPAGLQMDAWDAYQRMEKRKIFDIQKARIELEQIKLDRLKHKKNTIVKKRVLEKMNASEIEVAELIA